METTSRELKTSKRPSCRKVETNQGGRFEGVLTDQIMMVLP